MIERRIGWLVCLLWMGVVWNGVAQDDVGDGFWRDEPPERLVADLLARMSDEEIVAQTLLLGWPESQPNDDILQWIGRRSIGGVKVFGRNGADLETLVGTIAQMQRLAQDSLLGIPLFVATDQEGGWVRHVKGNTSRTPGNMAIGATGLFHDAYTTGVHIGRELHTLGINLNFAPTVDVYRNPEAHVIGPRAFSDDPVASALFGAAFFKGLRQARVIATAKHFPGHGNASDDSHGTLPVINDDFDALWETDLVPFRILIREGIPVILIGHLSYPNIAPDGAPASISSYMIDEVLRGRLGFDGLIITDDLYMGGTIQYGAQTGMSFAEICVEAIRAGNDMILLSRTPALNGELWQALLGAYRREPEMRRRFEEAARRVLRLKIAYLKGNDSVPLFPDSDAPRRLLDSERAQFFAEQAARSVTLIGDERIPYRPQPGERILLWGEEPAFRTIGRRRFPQARIDGPRGESFHHALPVDVARFRRIAPRFDTVIFCLASPADAQILREARSIARRVIVVSTLTPIYLRDMMWIHSAIAIYGRSDDSFRAGFAVLTGEIEANGTLPIDLR